MFREEARAENYLDYLMTMGFITRYFIWSMRLVEGHDEGLGRCYFDFYQWALLNTTHSSGNTICSATQSSSYIVAQARRSSQFGSPCTNYTFGCQ
jgi:hypothetical protein